MDISFIRKVMMTKRRGRKSAAEAKVERFTWFCMVLVFAFIYMLPEDSTAIPNWLVPFSGAVILLGSGIYQYMHRWVVSPITWIGGTIMLLLTAVNLTVDEGMDFYDIAATAEELAPDLLVGHSKGYPLARKLNIPLIRVGFPIHDRVGGQRILHLGYRGAQQLFDTIANALIARKQDMSDVGYSYM